MENSQEIAKALGMDFYAFDNEATRVIIFISFSYC